MTDQGGVQADMCQQPVANEQPYTQQHQQQQQQQQQQQMTSFPAQMPPQQQPVLVMTSPASGGVPSARSDPSQAPPPQSPLHPSHIQQYQQLPSPIPAFSPTGQPMPHSPQAGHLLHPQAGVHHLQQYTGIPHGSGMAPLPLGLPPRPPQQYLDHQPLAAMGMPSASYMETHDDDDETDSDENKGRKGPRSKKPHLQGRFSGRLATKEDEKRLAEECRLLAPLLGGVGKRGDRSRLTLAKIVRGIAMGEIRRHLEAREQAHQIVTQQLSEMQSAGGVGASGQTMRELHQAQQTITSLRRELDAKNRQIMELQTMLQEGKQPAARPMNNASAPISLAGAQFSQLAGIPLTQLPPAALAQLHGGPLQQISLQDLGQLTALPISLASLNQLGIQTEDGAFRLAPAPPLQLGNGQGGLTTVAVAAQSPMSNQGHAAMGLDSQSGMPHGDKLVHQQQGQMMRQDGPNSSQQGGVSAHNADERQVQWELSPSSMPPPQSQAVSQSQLQPAAPAPQHQSHTSQGATISGARIQAQPASSGAGGSGAATYSLGALPPGFQLVQQNTGNSQQFTLSGGTEGAQVVNVDSEYSFQFAVPPGTKLQQVPESVLRQLGLLQNQQASGQPAFVSIPSHMLSGAANNQGYQTLQTPSQHTVSLQPPQQQATSQQQRA